MPRLSLIRAGLILVCLLVFGFGFLLSARHQGEGQSFVTETSAEGDGQRPDSATPDDESFSSFNELSLVAEQLVDIEIVEEIGTRELFTVGGELFSVKAIFSVITHDVLGGAGQEISEIGITSNEAKELNLRRGDRFIALVARTDGTEGGETWVLVEDGRGLFRENVATDRFDAVIATKTRDSFESADEIALAFDEARASHLAAQQASEPAGPFVRSAVALDSGLDDVVGVVLDGLAPEEHRMGPDVERFPATILHCERGGSGIDDCDLGTLKNVSVLRSESEARFSYQLRPEIVVRGRPIQCELDACAIVVVDSNNWSRFEVVEIEEVSLSVSDDSSNGVRESGRSGPLDPGGSPPSELRVIVGFEPGEPVVVVRCSHPEELLGSDGAVASLDPSRAANAGCDLGNAVIEDSTHTGAVVALLDPRDSAPVIVAALNDVSRAARLEN